MQSIASSVAAAEPGAALRALEFARLDRRNAVYLDQTGAALAPHSLIRAHARRLSREILGNPHSDSPASRRSTQWMQRARDAVLAFLDADASDYTVIFTSNASTAIGIVSQAFPVQRGSHLLLCADNHNSVNGMRVNARRRHAEVEYLPLDGELRMAPFAFTPARAPSLFAFPAQSNFSGVQHPLALVHDAQTAGYRVLLDAAAFVPANRLSLRECTADYVAISFYKIFGYPTGIGALIVRNDALQQLRRWDFAGGTVDYVSVAHGLHKLRPGSDRFEDGTPNFMAYPAVVAGLQWIERTRIDAIHTHCTTLTEHALHKLRGAVIYGPRSVVRRGGTIAFNLLVQGQTVPYERIEGELRRSGISVRGGCFCNPGAAERALGLDDEAAGECLRSYRRRAFTLARFRDCLHGAAVGAIRVSFGASNTIEDIDRLATALAHIQPAAFA